MRDKRFIMSKNVAERDHTGIIDVEKQSLLWVIQVVDLLNEQQTLIIELQERIIDLKDDKNQLHKVISKLRQEVAELKIRNSVLSSKLNQIPKSIKEVWLDE